MANGLLDPVYKIKPNVIDGIRRSGDAQGRLGSLEIAPGNLSIAGRSLTLRRALPVTARGHLVVTGRVHRFDKRRIFTRGHVNVQGRSVVLNTLGATVAWATLPAFQIDRTTAVYPKYFNNIRSTYLIDPSAKVTSVTIENVDPANVAVITYEDSPNDRIKIASDPGSNVIDTVNMRAHVASSSSTSADWAARIAGPGVMWYHNFDTVSEMTRFRVSEQPGVGAFNDPNGTVNPSRVGLMTWSATGGADNGGYIRCLRPAGTTDGPFWMRVFSPLDAASNGRGVADPAGTIAPYNIRPAGGTITPATFTPSDFGNQTANWTLPVAQHSQAYYGHSDYSSLDSGFDGTDFYMQVRVRMDPRRTLMNAAAFDINTGGKTVWFTKPYQTSNGQEIVVTSGTWRGPTDHMQPTLSARNFVNGYFNQGAQPWADTPLNPTTGAPIGDGLRIQWGSQFSANGFNWYNTPPDNLTNCFAYSFGWDTFLYHVTMGHQNGLGSYQPARLEVWACSPPYTSASQYVKIWDFYYQQRFDYTNGWMDSGHTLPEKFGLSMLILSTYHNGYTGNATTTDYFVDYDQVIFSKAYIPCPLA